MRDFGIDISVWQKNIDLNKAKNEGVKFTIIRAMYGNAKDTAFESLYNRAKANGLGVGAYQWGRAVNVAQAKEEAELLIEHCLKNKQFDYPIYYDVEDKLILNKSINEATEIIKAWCDTLESHGYYAGIYMSESCFKNEVKGSELAKRYTQWRAIWSTENKKPDAQMWQFGGETNLIRSNKVANMVCDQDYCYVDFPSIIKSGGFNGYRKQAQDTTPSKKSDEEIANEVINGLWGNGEDRKNRLTQAGYDYSKIQAIVNSKLINKNIIQYKIKKGDNLYNIAKKYNTTWLKIYNDNRDVIGNNPSLIYEGTILKIRK